MLLVFGGQHLKKKKICLKSTLKGLNHIYIKKKGEKILSKKTIVKVRKGGGRRGMVKDHTFALFNFWTLP